METSVYCNRCQQKQEPRSQSVAASCSHLFCLQCAQELVDKGACCPVCEMPLTKNSLKVVKLFQDAPALQVGG